MTTRVQVAVVGGGIGGLAAAAFLRARGFEVGVFEAHGRPAVERTTRVGNGIHLYFHCARMLVRAGVPVREYLTPLDIQMRRDDGRVRADISRSVQLRLSPALASTRASVYSLLRQNLYKALVAHTPEQILHCDKRCVRATQRDDEVVVEFDDGSSVTADLVVGADGIHSVLADQLFGRRPLIKHDIVIIQGVASYDRLDPIETWVLHRGGGTMGLVPVVLASGRPGTFWWISVPIAERDELAQSDLECWHVISERFRWAPVRSIVETTVPDSLERWHSQDKDPLPRWSQGRIVLLGDACHAANPFSGYGAGMSIEDGYWLVDKLGDPGVLAQPQRLAAAITGYERKRAPFTAAIVEDARKLMRILHPNRRILAEGLNAAWNSGVVGKLVARKFTNVFAHGLAETEWTASERAAARLEL